VVESTQRENEDRRANEDDRSPVAKASAWATRIMTISLEMVLPGLAGVWLDGWLGTKVVFTLAGFALGGTAAIVHLIHLTRALQKQHSGGAQRRANEDG
jgi:ATP synthase protein I